MTEINTNFIYKNHSSPQIILPEEERLGFAKRQGSYKKTLKFTQHFKDKMNELPFLVTKSALFHVVGQGLKFLSSPEKNLLAFYVSFLNMAELSKGKSYIWAGTRLTCELLGISQKTLRRHKASLEGKGLILRNYDRRNRPEEGQAIDLLPFIARLEEYQAAIEEVFGKQRDYWQKMQSTQSVECEGKKPLCDGSKKSAQAVISVPLKQTLIDLSVSVPKKENRGVAVNSKSSAFRGHGTIKNRFGLPDQGDLTSGSFDAQKSPQLLSKGSRLNLDNPSQLSTLNLPETPPKSVFEALALSPDLLGGQGVDDLKSLSNAKLLDWLSVRIAAIFPLNNTASHTWPWSIKKFGWRAVELLVVSIEDPQIKDGSKFLGGMTHKWNFPLQLSPNIKRIKALQDKGKIVKKQAQKTVELKLMSSFHERLSHQLNQGDFLGWFSKVRVIETADHLTLITEKPFHAHWLKDNFTSQISHVSLGKKLLIKSKKEG